MIALLNVVSQISAITWCGAGSTGRSCAMVLRMISEKVISVPARAAVSRSKGAFRKTTATYQSAISSTTTVPTGSNLSLRKLGSCIVTPFRLRATTSDPWRRCREGHRRPV
ncbi:hypothetical protein D9M72_543830 [compost metagenome]